MKTNLNLFALVNLFALGCGSADLIADVDGSDVTASSQSSLSGKTYGVTWQVTDRIGRGYESTVDVDGRVGVRFDGSEFVLATGQTAQNARVALELPDFVYPDELVRRDFFVRYMVYVDAAGNKQYRAGSYSPSAIVDASVPRARSVFERTYNAETNTAQEYFRYGDDVNGATLGFNLDTDGALSLENDIAKFQPFGVSSDFIYLNSAKHNFSVYVK